MIWEVLQETGSILLIKTKKKHILPQKRFKTVNPMLSLTAKL